MIFIKLFSSVKITEGVKNAIIFDTNSGFLSFIPKGLFSLLHNEKQNYSFLKKQLDGDDVSTLDEYIDFIISNKLGFKINTKKELLSFQNEPDLKSNPTNIEYLILDLQSKKDLDDNIIEQIQYLRIKYLQIRILDQVKTSDVLGILSKINLLNDSELHEISFITKFDENVIDFIKYTANLSNKFLNIILHSADNISSSCFGSIQLDIIRNKIIIPSSCGCISMKNFILNNNFHIESQYHNSCLHKKIGIDVNGNIKNCPSMPQSFGNIKDKTLEKALNHKDFKKYWNLTKDKVEVCKDCEFRYICTDCRAYTEKTHENKEGLDISKPLKCGYDPYTGEWEEWSTNPLKQKAINYYGLLDLKIKN